MKIILCSFLCLDVLQAQETVSYGRMADCELTVQSRKQPLMAWFEWIEKEAGIRLAYNPAQISLSREVEVRSAGTVTVGELLKQLLSGYRFQTMEAPSRKLLIQVLPPEEYELSGMVREEESGEKLYGAVLWLEGADGKTYSAVTSENGFYRLALPQGKYHLKVSYMGYRTHESEVYVHANRWTDVRLKPQWYELGEVTVRPLRQLEEMGECTPSNSLSFSSSNLFSQIWVLSGVIGGVAGGNFQVDGGNEDENLILLDGVPVYHPGHINSALPVFNGDAVKRVTFHKGFFPTRFEGRISSVTEVALKDGNKQEFRHTVSMDMPAVSAFIEGPLIKNKLSYAIGGRRSWMDLFDELLSQEFRMNHSFYDFNLKLSYDFSPKSSLDFLMYRARDEFHIPTDDDPETPILKWNSQIYQLRLRTSWRKMENTTAVSWTDRTDWADGSYLGLDLETAIVNRVSTWNVSSEFCFHADEMYEARWGVRASLEKFRLPSFGSGMEEERNEWIGQYSLFYENQLRLTTRFFLRIGINGVGYDPRNSKNYFSIQPRLSLKYTLGEKDLIYADFSRMEQFYHTVRLDNTALPTDFRMPSIDGYRPRTSEHYEMGWKHLGESGQLECAVYYKTRRNVVALKPEVYPSDNRWEEYVMVGDGESYGVRLYGYRNWPHWMLQASYAYGRSREWFPDLKERGKMPSLYDIPHSLTLALSYKYNEVSAWSLGGICRSGRVRNTDAPDFESLSSETFRTERMSFSYRLDASYSFRKSFGGKLFLFRLGLYNIVGNPTEEDVINFYSIYLDRHCLPYGSFSLRF